MFIVYRIDTSYVNFSALSDNAQNWFIKKREKENSFFITFYQLQDHEKEYIIKYFLNVR